MNYKTARNPIYWTKIIILTGKIHKSNFVLIFVNLKLKFDLFGRCCGEDWMSFFIFIFRKFLFFGLHAVACQESGSRPFL
jgi:hypothetical protein